jgi:hypothetical protein
MRKKTTFAGLRALAQLCLGFVIDLSGQRWNFVLFSDLFQTLTGGLRAQ